MPARRLRTLQWRRSLEEIQERAGSLEMAVARDYDDAEAGAHLIFRVPLRQIGESEIVVEHPVALGRHLPFEDAAELVAIFAIGQNRWSFRTRVVGRGALCDGRGREVAILRLAMPDRVDRCQRRDYYRMNTAHLSLPDVDLWPLLDLQSVVLAERANELAIELERSGDDMPPVPAGSDIRPEVGPPIRVTLLNVGGGGIGVGVPQEHAQILSRTRFFWTSLSLAPEIRTPFCATARVVHTHLEGGNTVYAGMAFEFAHNPVHQRFVSEQICRFIALQQRANHAMRGGPAPVRQSA